MGDNSAFERRLAQLSRGHRRVLCPEDCRSCYQDLGTGSDHPSGVCRLNPAVNFNGCRVACLIE